MLFSVYIVVGIVSLGDTVIAPSFTEDSMKATIHPAKDESDEKGLNLDKNPILGDSIKLDRQHVTQSSILDTTSPTTISDGGDSKPHDATYDSRRQDKTVDAILHNTTDNTGDSRPDNTTNNIEFHQTTVDVKGVDVVPGFPNQTLSQGTDSATLSPLVRNVSFINESQTDNQGNPEQLSFKSGRISNASKFWNRTYYNDKNRNDTCSMIKSVTFMFTLGRKMPLYIDVISLVLGAIGIIGNLATIAVVAFNFKLRKPYFFTILTLAVADLLSIFIMIGTIFLEFEIAIYIHCIKPPFYVLISFFLSVQLNSLFQVVLIAIIKFLLLVYPVESRTYVTNNLIVALFFVILSYSTCFSCFACYLIMQKVKANEDTSTVLMGIFILTVIPSILLIILLHFIKVAKLSKSQALQKETQKMNKVVSIILFIYIAYNCHKFSNQIILTLTQNIELLHILHKSLTISAFIHHGCNPLIYAAFTCTFDPETVAAFEG